MALAGPSIAVRGGGMGGENQVSDGVRCRQEPCD